MKSCDDDPPTASGSPKSESNESTRSHIHIDELLNLMGHASEKPVIFEVKAPPDSQVFIAGSFNNWDPKSLPLAYHPEDGVFRETLLLPCGRHEYKFIIDGVWVEDVCCKNRVITSAGTVNSVLVV